MCSCEIKETTSEGERIISKVGSLEMLYNVRYGTTNLKFFYVGCQELIHRSVRTPQKARFRQYYAEKNKRNPAYSRRKTR